MPRASSRPTYRRREEKKEKEISPASKIERFLLFRGGGGGRRVENRAEKRSIVKLAGLFGLDLMEESRNDRLAVLAEEEGSGGGGDDDRSRHRGEKV